MTSNSSIQIPETDRHHDSNTRAPSDTTMDISGINSETAKEQRYFRLLDLPVELIGEILGFLSPVELSHICRTCRMLNTQASNERLWKSFLDGCALDAKCRYSRPFSSWKEMYGTHHPYWFLPRHKIWFSDKTTPSNPLVGQLILVRYDHRIGSIEGYRLVAEHPDADTVVGWAHDASVLIANFNPVVSIFLDPVVKLDIGAFEKDRNRLQQEVILAQGGVHPNYRIRSRLFPAIPIPPNRQFLSMSLWPPPTIPAAERVRNESASGFKDLAHKPSSYDEMSTTTFRLRKELLFNERLGFRIAKDVITYGTILPEYYTPTKDKPYQGMWVGDYSGHGCEFLVIIQSTPEEAQYLEPVHEIPSREEVEGLLPPIRIELPPVSAPDPRGCQGRLDAIKLTGDPNVPRGQPSWIAEDIGRSGLLRIAQEEEFRGARVVKSSGHISTAGFQNDRYTPSQLILISEDRLAQYWVEMRRISYLQRINIDDYLKIE